MICRRFMIFEILNIHPIDTTMNEVDIIIRG